MFGNHGLCGLLEEGAYGKSPKCLGGNLGDFGKFCKGLGLFEVKIMRQNKSFGCLQFVEIPTMLFCCFLFVLILH